MHTNHQYVALYPILPDSRKLILGTIHPHHHVDFKIPFFYGNRLSLWNILNEAFGNEMGSVITVNSILNFLNARKIAISDTVLQCTRKNESALDKDLIPTELNFALLPQIKNSTINEIFFTSGFGKNNAFKLFYEGILHQKITNTIKDEKGLLLNSSFFGRPVKLSVLPSPSGSANGAISKSKGYLKLKGQYAMYPKPIKQYRIDFYKNAFSN